MVNSKLFGVGLMDEKSNFFVNTCDFMSVRPIMEDLPYPPVQVRNKNQRYANLLSIDYCGSVSEMSAITQYINNESILSGDNCQMAKTILGIAMAEMIHLQKLAALIILLGGSVDYVARYKDNQQKMWTPQYITMSDNPVSILRAGIQSENEAIHQYRVHMNIINDNYVNAVLARIIKDEEYHIMLLKAMMR